MKTAVEWLVSEVAKNGLSMKHKDYLEIIEKALEMEKEQKIKFAENCLDKALDLDIRTAFSNVEKYYNKTFKQPEQCKCGQQKVGGYSCQRTDCNQNL
jgi:hypothetical protein